MNNVNLIGRLVKDPETRYTQGEKPTAITRYTIAVNRNFKKEGQPTADFISCIAFGKNGEFVQNYFKKGMQIAISGRIQTGSYEKDDKKVYTTDIISEQHFFADSRKEENSNNVINDNVADDGFYPIENISKDDEDSLPF